MLPCAFIGLRPIGGIALLGLSVLLGYIRFATGLHYPSDLLAGMGLGIFLGCFMFML